VIVVSLAAASLAALAALTPEVLEPIRSVPPEVAGRFRDARAFQQTAAGRDLHLALNSGIPLAAPDGGVLLVFHAGVPAFRKYDRSGRLIYERQLQGAETDALIARLPTRWPRKEDELPLVRPTVRTAAVDRRGNLWVSLVDPFTYVFDGDGDKIRVVQFRGAGLLIPTALFFTASDRLLVTPGLHEFSPWPDR
jgi:hypothetical protein